MGNVTYRHLRRRRGRIAVPLQRERVDDAGLENHDDPLRPERQPGRRERLRGWRDSHDSQFLSLTTGWWLVARAGRWLTLGETRTLEMPLTARVTSRGFLQASTSHQH